MLHYNCSAFNWRGGVVNSFQLHLIHVPPYSRNSTLDVLLKCHVYGGEFPIRYWKRTPPLPTHTHSISLQKQCWESFETSSASLKKRYNKYGHVMVFTTHWSIHWVILSNQNTSVSKGIIRDTKHHCFIFFFAES